METPLRLRPHHGLCIYGFRGRGYSREFTAHMSEVVQKLKDIPTTKIVVTKGCDDLCRCCPNNKDGQCTSKKPEHFDEAVRERAGLTYGETLAWDELCLKTRPLYLHKLDEICASCEWHEMCRAIRGEQKYL